MNTPAFYITIGRIFRYFFVIFVWIGGMCQFLLQKNRYWSDLWIYVYVHFLCAQETNQRSALQGRLQKYNLYKVRFKRPEIRESEFPKWNFNCLAPRNPLLRPHFKGANGIKVISILTPLQQKSAAKAVYLFWVGATRFSLSQSKVLQI